MAACSELCRMVKAPSALVAFSSASCASEIFLRSVSARFLYPPRCRFSFFSSLLPFSADEMSWSRTDCDLIVSMCVSW